MCGEGAVTDQTWQKWFAKFHAGDFSLDGAPQLGRPVEVDSDQIETLTENNQCYTMREIADLLKISKSIKLLVKMKNVFFILWKKPCRLFGQPNISSNYDFSHQYNHLPHATFSYHIIVLQISNLLFMVITTMKSEVRLTARSHYLMLKATHILLYAMAQTWLRTPSCLKEKGTWPFTLSLLLLAGMWNQ